MSSEIERLAVVETKVDSVLTEITMLRSDVQKLLLSGARSTGAWGLVVRIVPFGALAVAAAAYLR